MKIDPMKVSVDRKTVFDMIDCREDSPVYEEMLKAYEELLPQVLTLAQGRCIFGMGEIMEADATEDCPAGTRVLYVISTVGKSLSHLETELFASGDYVGGMLADAMADACLFSLEAEWQEAVKCFCAEHGIGITTRLEAPSGLPMSVQKTAFEYLDAGGELEMGISSGYMYDPVKSSCQVLVVSEDPGCFRAQHDCSRCPQKECKMRKRDAVIVTVCSEHGSMAVTCEAGESILEAYRRQGGYVNAVCGGKGFCGKCKIRLISGNLEITEADRAALDEAALQDGFRLSCRAYPRADCVVELCVADESEFQAVDRFTWERETESALTPEPGKKPNGRKRAGIAIDIGTTTMAAQMIDLDSGELLASCSTINHQRGFGADVISRIEASGQGSGGELQRLVRSDIKTMVSTLLNQAGISGSAVDRMILAGNTTMGHLLMGYPCETLGVYPFTPVNTGLIRDTCQNLIGSEELDCETILMPGISTFVGGDIVSGLYACGFETSEKVNLLVDLGTNGEMAIGCRERLLVTSTAAGPAFEGGNISCGTGSIPGAICHVQITSDDQAEITTIENRPPVGICGTGVIEITAELLKRELIDETGLLDEEYFEEGFPIATAPDGGQIVFTQKDVREIQLAKSAVRAGVETLIRRYGIGYEAIDHVYLAGGFGFKMDRDAAVAAGLFPEELKEKITAIGNSSLAGAVRALREAHWEDMLGQLVGASTEIALSNDADFNELYMTHMMFGEE